MTKGQLLVLCLGTVIGLGCVWVVFVVLGLLVMCVNRMALLPIEGLALAAKQSVGFLGLLLDCGAWVVREFLRLFLWWAIP